MKQISKPTDYVFQVSWEVCNKVGGIYTVLSTQAKVLQQIYKDDLIYIGPDLQLEEQTILFEQDATLLPAVKEKAGFAGISIKIGRWNVPGRPIAILVDWRPLYADKDNIYAEMWRNFSVDSLSGYGDYDESCLFAYQAGRVATLAYEAFANARRVQNNASSSLPTAVLHAHEWMSGFALLYVKSRCPNMATVFTTHATTVGRSITTNHKQLYAYFDGYIGDQMAKELNVEAKHSVEKAAAIQADCMTTVSEVTDRECKQFLGRKSDILLLNGFDPSVVYKGSELKAVRKRARKALLNTYNALSGSYLNEDTLIVSTSGRNDFICKGFDVFISAIKRLQESDMLKRDILAVIAVPCWKKAPRQDLLKRLENKPAIKLLDASSLPPLPNPFITHELYNFDSERIVNTIFDNKISFGKEQKAHLLFIPSYLDGQDGVINLSYYDFLTASDYCVYPSYYEPWGYTPLESVSFGIPCLTTNLSGFGQWVNQEVGHHAILSDGVTVLQRNDWNFNQCVEDTATSMQGVAMLSTQEYAHLQEAAYRLAKHALWKDFIRNYINAYILALKLAKRHK